jgi:hypothetical protein
VFRRTAGRGEFRGRRRRDHPRHHSGAVNPGTVLPVYVCQHRRQRRLAPERHGWRTFSTCRRRIPSTTPSRGSCSARVTAGWRRGSLLLATRRSRGAQMAVFLRGGERTGPSTGRRPRPGRSSPTCPATAFGGGLHRGARPARHHLRLRRRRVLPLGCRDARPDGALPAEGRCSARTTCRRTRRECSTTCRSAPSRPTTSRISTLAGVTAGCSASPPLYCPSRQSTRFQMAAFLALTFGL